MHAGGPRAGSDARLTDRHARPTRPGSTGLQAALVVLLVLGLLLPAGASAAPEPGGQFSAARSQLRPLPGSQRDVLEELALLWQKPPASPLNGRFLLLNMHGALFHEQARAFQENVAYARWLGAGVIRVFATDNNTLKPWNGRQLGQHIATMAPIFRAGGVKLLVALVNNHRPVPGEAAESAGWMDGYQQLLLPFYTRTWRGAYLSFVRDLISTVRERGALDIIYAWELGNELHTPQDPPALMPFITAAVEEIRRLDPATPIFPGTMGVNHLEPWNIRSAVARWLYCEAPVDAYTLHAYDWVSRVYQGDMPIEWDLDYVTAEPCPSGRTLPVIVEELGTSRALPGRYAAEEPDRRLEQELRQLRFVLGFNQVRGLGVWSAESPRVESTYFDQRRGLTSYGPQALGGGSCYDPTPSAQPGPRCQLERVLRALPALP
ncbi:MAG: hypothetical protein HY690_00920 [Chloroflexi bacterium]|nr:hypothetical protein [Chloroflexota bacterium]